MKRRNFISNFSALSIATTLSPSSIAETSSKKKKKTLKIAWLSDTHVKPTDIAETGMRKAFRHANNLNPSPDFIINGVIIVLQKINGILLYLIVRRKIMVDILHELMSHNLHGLKMN